MLLKNFLSGLKRVQIRWVIGIAVSKHWQCVTSFVSILEHCSIMQSIYQLYNNYNISCFQNFRENCKILKSSKQIQKQYKPPLSTDCITVTLQGLFSNMEANSIENINCTILCQSSGWGSEDCWSFQSLAQGCDVMYEKCAKFCFLLQNQQFSNNKIYTI